ncbi:MAG: hypothetical protein ACREEP_21760 [Dongiaceae bacterium]
MRPVLIAVLVAMAGSWANAVSGQMTPEQVQEAEAFAAGVRALDPHTEESEPPFLALVERYVPDAGRVQVFLDFMTASGFECPPITSLAVNEFKIPIFRCTFAPDLGPAGKPNLSSVIEETSFGVTAECDEKRYIMRIEGYMTHWATGP